ncbi:MAG TPA: hypothetical protein VN282_14380 [Pyrinomonadaceae bacterium]|nr:hypothetical protein [Pyrinomonadaceae bacterium]
MGTQIDVRVIAKGGKYLGDDIGGALVTVHDVRTGELLARGKTAGGSGESNLMSVRVTQAEVLPVGGASVFTAALELDGPRLIRVTAYGPLAAPQSANTATLTQWVCPGRDVTGGAQGGGFLLEIPGLMVQILNPPTHFLPASGQAPAQLEVRANVTMMCGCPIGVEPWEPSLFDVSASIRSGDTYSVEFPLAFVPPAESQYGAPSQFKALWDVPQNASGQPQIYSVTVTAFQQLTGNTGVDGATVIIPASPPTQS